MFTFPEVSKVIDVEVAGLNVMDWPPEFVEMVRGPPIKLKAPPPPVIVPVPVPDPPMLRVALVDVVLVLNDDFCTEPAGTHVDTPLTVPTPNPCAAQPPCVASAGGVLLEQD